MSMYKSIILSLLSFVVPVGGFLIFKNPAGDTVLSVIMALIIVPALYDPLLTCIDYANQINFAKAGLVQIDGILNEPLFKAKTMRKKKRVRRCILIRFHFRIKVRQTHCGSKLLIPFHLLVMKMK